MCTSFKAEILTNHTHTENNETSVSTKLFKRRSVPVAPGDKYAKSESCRVHVLMTSRGMKESIL